MIGLITAYMVHTNGMRQVDSLVTGHAKMLEMLQEIEKKIP